MPYSFDEFLLLDSSHVMDSIFFFRCWASQIWAILATCSRVQMLSLHADMAGLGSDLGHKHHWEWLAELSLQSRSYNCRLLIIFENPLLWLLWMSRSTSERNESCSAVSIIEYELTFCKHKHAYHSIAIHGNVDVGILQVKTRNIEVLLSCEPNPMHIASSHQCRLPTTDTTHEPPRSQFHN